MTVELLEGEGTDAEELVIAWLNPLGHVAFKRAADDPLPSRVVRRVAGDEDVDEALDTAVVSVHTFCAATDPDAALAECVRTHQRMLYLARNPLVDVELSDGRIANVEWLTVAEKPIWVDYTDLILRKVGRYQIGLTINAE